MEKLTRNSSWKTRTILFLVSQSITLFGTTLVHMAIVWFVTLKTSSGTWVSALTVAAYLPQFLISFVAGVWADRFDRKKLIIHSDATIALATLALLLMMPSLGDGNGLLYAILVVLVIRSIGSGIQMPAVSSMIPQLVPEEQLMRYNGINATMQSVVQFAAPAAAGALLSFSTLGSTLMIDIVTAIIGIGLLSCILIPRSSALVEESASLLSDMKLGLKYVFADGFLGRLIVVYGLFIFLAVPAGFLCALLVSRVFGDNYAYLTIVELVGFAGMAGGGVLMSTWGGFTDRVKTLLIGILTFGVLAVGMGLTRNFIFYLVLMLIYGVVLTMIQTATTTLIQEKSSPEMVGRVFGLMGSMYSGFLPIGMVVFGPMADVIPLQLIMVGSGMAQILMALIMKADRRFKPSEK